ncbi:PDZ domain-containing protein [Promicromonospora thailandica]|uniref:PDZ domain-containing protein n=1 Tax=Promicromonospora thailandica TaxID=765201 RepID=A0A9X2JVE6_9MICO|nr:PDZ domain-containing protein [Promicromonospora thailandica]MCP2264991.1 PDZ domain-containing protein [Promicromonospora thailandica]
MRDRQSTPQPEPAPFEDLPPEAAPITRRTMTLGVSMLVTAILAALALVVPTPYAMRSPGPTEDTLAQDLIQIEGARTYESTGELRLTTVSVLGGPGYPMTAGQVIQGWLDPRRSVLPVEAIFPETTTQEEQQEVSQAEMVSSQESATAAALTELNYDVPAVLDVAGTEEGSGAAGLLEEGDVITEFQGEPVGTYADLIDGLAATEPGDTVTLGVRRGDRTLDVDITTTGNGERAVLGVFIDPRYDFPVDVSIEIENIGGPSAGTMFALGIIDKLTAEDEANGQVIAGTGTMSPEGTVGPIGGIEQKLYGAVRDGATWFLAPADNCDQVVGNVPDGLHVARVSTLAEARAAVEQIGRGHGADLPTCS